MHKNYKTLSITFINKFLSRVKFTEECWEWQASRLSSGYGQSYMINASERRRSGKPHQEGAHRVSYKMYYKKDIPDGYLVRHSCDNKICVNPFHLSIGTQKDNMKDCKMSEKASNRSRRPNGTFI